MRIGRNADIFLKHAQVGRIFSFVRRISFISTHNEIYLFPNPSIVSLYFESSEFLSESTEDAFLSKLSYRRESRTKIIIKVGCGGYEE